MFKIIIKNLNLFGYHGVRESEKKNGQNFCFNIEILLNSSDIPATDNLDDTLNYSRVIELVKDINSSQRCDLLETLSRVMAGRIMEMSLLIERVAVRIEKTSPPAKENLDSLGIEYVLDRKNFKSSDRSIDKSDSGREPEPDGADVYMSLGSNIGNKENNLKKAVELINRNPNIRVLRVSSIYETEPMYLKDQNYFYNIVLKAKAEGGISPFEVLGFLKGIEFGFGSKKDTRYGPRIIDIDLLYFGEMFIDSDFLTIPHPGVEERKFVLVPLSEIAPEFVIKGKNIEEFIEQSGLTEEVKRVKGW
jgi:dihydroneopterin aldolase / 2-amino-4-hydroxy-6-hydroxymethyldihydropteridine diphosphokinase